MWGAAKRRGRSYVWRGEGTSLNGKGGKVKSWKKFDCGCCRKMYQSAKSLLRLSRGSEKKGCEKGSDKGDQESPKGSGSGSSLVSPHTLLFLHSRTNKAEELEKLLKDSHSLANEKDYDDRTALHVAATHGCVDAAKVLLKYGANINALDRWSNSPLADAKSAGQEAMVRVLQQKGGKLLGHHGSSTEQRPIQPPFLKNSDWEIDPSEIDLRDSVKIGKGSFGEIIKVNWRGTPVAVKRILPALCDDKLVVQDFTHEVQLLVKMRHPNIVQFLGAVTKQPPLMLITEFLTGGDLHNVIKKGPVLPKDALNYALDMARGMTYLHSGPSIIIHRDLKPRNILIGEGGQLKVGDFGLSKLMRIRSLHDIYNMTGETGSYRYMAPEVFEHRPYDTSVDVFSFAIILYEIFEGTPPFPDMDAYKAAKSVKEGERPPFTSKHYPEGMKELIENCWNGHAASRPKFIDIIQKLEKISHEVAGAREHHHMWPFTSHSPGSKS